MYIMTEGIIKHHQRYDEGPRKRFFIFSVKDLGLVCDKNFPIIVGEAFLDSDLSLAI